MLGSNIGVRNGYKIRVNMNERIGESGNSINLIILCLFTKL